MKNSLLVKLVACSAFAIIFTACTSAPKGELSSTANPSEEIGRLSADLSKAQESNLDVLARNEFLKSYKFLELAKEDLANGKKQEKIIDDLRYGKESLKKAYMTAEGRQNKASSLFEARQKAIKAGASQSSKLSKTWTRLDEDLSTVADRIDKVSPADIEDYQARYIELEKMAVIETHLGRASAQVNGARDDGAEKSAPVSFRKSDMSLKNAESLIGSNVNNPLNFKSSVIQANYDAQFLVDVLDTIKQNGKSMTEAAAAKLVRQKRQITNLREDLITSEGVISDNEVELQQKNAALNEAQANVAIQIAMEKSRQQFSNKEAEAYQQGGNLLIRLKSMNFQSGHSELPTQSILLLAKVSEVAKSLNAKEIMVEGHTDSMGTVEMNKKLSEQRASAVATYFRANGFESTQIQSMGYGFEKPLATNKSKVGRSQNRRVDIVITPASEPKRNPFYEGRR